MTENKKTVAKYMEGFIESNQEKILACLGMSMKPEHFTLFACLKVYMPCHFLKQYLMKFKYS